MNSTLLKKVIPIIIFLLILQFLLVPFVMNSSGEYLDRLMKRSIATFTVLTGIKTTLSIIEGSSFTVEGGVNFVLKGSMGSEIQIGDIVQSILDIVDYGWRISLFSMVVIKCMIILKNISGDWSNLMFILISVFLFIQIFDTRRFNYDKVKKVSMFCFVILFLFYIAFPATVYLSGKFSSMITSKYSNDYQKGLGDFSDKVKSIDVNSLKDENMSMDIIQKLTLKLKGITERGIEMLDSILTFSIIFLLDIFVIPFIVFYFFYKVLIVISNSILKNIRM